MLELDQGLRPWWARAWPLFALTAAAAAVVMVATSPAQRPETQARADLRSWASSDRVRLRGEAPALQREVRFAWPAKLVEGDPAKVRVAFTPTSGSRGAPQPSEVAPAPDAATQARAASARTAVALPTRAMTVSLAARGFELAHPALQARTLDLPDDAIHVEWEVTPIQADRHELAFQFATAQGDVEVEPSRFDVKVERRARRWTHWIIGGLGIAALPGLVLEVLEFLAKVAKVSKFAEWALKRLRFRRRSGD